MLRLLIKKTLSEQYAGWFFNPKKNVARSRVGTVSMILFTVVFGFGVFGGLMALLGSALAEPLAMSGMGWLYFVIIGLLGLLLGVVGGAFSAYTNLYKGRDNDLLLSLPIPPSKIIQARIISVYLVTGIFSLVAILPPEIVYWIRVRPGVLAVIAGVLFALAISVLALVLGCLLGLVVAKISTKLKNKSIVTVLISLLVMGIYYFFYFRFQTLMRNISTDPESFRRLENVPGLKFFGQAGEGHLLPLAALLALAGVLMAVTLLLLVRSFYRVISDANKVSRVTYKAKDEKQKSLSRALLGRELRHLVSSPGYMLNSSIGSFFLILAAGAVLIKGGELVDLLRESGLPAVDDVLTVGAAALVGFMAAANTLTAPAVSLEGKGLWLVRSLPVTGWQILKAKLDLHLAVTGIPALLCSIACILVIKPGVLNSVLLLLFPQLFILLFASFGLVMGLLRPNLTWTNEMVPIKQSLSVLLTMFGGMFFGGALAVLYFLLARKLGGPLYLLLACLLTAVPACLLLLWLRRRGTARFESL